MLEIAKEQPKYDEQYPLRLMKHECEKRGIGFVTHYGVRDFLYTGHSFGVTTYEDWNNVFQGNGFHSNVKQHYRNELKLTLHGGCTWLLRTKNSINNIFLEELYKIGMGNCLAIYQENIEGARAYFFTAPHSIESIILRNNITAFWQVVSQVEAQILKVRSYTNKLIAIRKTPILSHAESQIIFNAITNLRNNLQVCVDGKDFIFTPQETKIISNFIQHPSITALSISIGLTVAGVEFHVNNIKNKLKRNDIPASNRNEFIEFIKKLRKIVKL